MAEIKMCGHGLLADCCVDCLRARVAKLEAALAAAESAYSEAIAGALDQRDAAEKRVAELEQTRELLREDWYAEQRRRDAAEQRVKRLDGVLRGLEQCIFWSDTVRRWGLVGNERALPALAAARAALAASDEGTERNGAECEAWGCEAWPTCEMEHRKQVASRAESERRAVVEYLRTAARREEWGDLSQWTKHSAVSECVADLATAIERGEHVAASGDEPSAQEGGR